MFGTLFLIHLATPAAGTVIPTIIFNLTATITSTIKFTVQPVDVDPQLAFVANPAYAPSPATVTWTTSETIRCPCL